MTTQILKEVYKRVIKEDKELQFKISKANKGKMGEPVSYRTIETWLRTDSDKLTTATTLQIIRDHLKLSKEEVLCVSKEEAEVIQS
jgi:hypothetical protein